VPRLRLLIGNKNYSSWSLRPWLVLEHAGIPFEEEVISFNADDFKARVTRYSPVGKVPVLVDGDLAIWDSLAIVEYLAETFPDKALWPADRGARARARSICAEMHSSFQHMRSTLTMNLSVRFPHVLLTVGAQRDVARIIDMWADCRSRFGAEGPFLFGRFSIADAFFAPVTRRFITYDVKLPEVAARYVATIDALPAMQEWVAAARAENDFVPEDEPYRERP
jgi:glutathione S-transferase